MISKEVAASVHSRLDGLTVGFCGGASVKYYELNVRFRAPC